MDLNAYINGVSRKVQDAVNNILNSDGIRGISCDNEYDQLSGLLAGTKDKSDAEYIEGFMIEWQDRKNAAQPPETEKAPEEKPTVPEEKPTVPEEKPTVPEEKPAVPEEKPTVPEEKPAVPEEKQKEPEAKPAGPEVKPPVENNVQPSVKKPAPTTPERKTNVVNADNSVNQKGVNNINVGPGATVIVAADTPIGIGVNPPVDEGTLVPTPPEPEKPSVKLKDLSPKEIKAARDYGKVVADRLFGHTSNYDQSIVQDIIEKRVNPDNVIEFIRGFEEALKDERKIKWYETTWEAAAGLSADHAFEQLLTEYDFPEKQKMMRKLAKDLQAHIEARHGEYISKEDANEIPVTLLEGYLDENDAKKLDNIALREMRNGDYKH